MKISNSPPKVFYVYNTIKDELEEYKNKYNIMKENAETLAKRIDKAIEYIEEEITQGKDIYCKEKVDGIIVLEILKMGVKND